MFRSNLTLVKNGCAFHTTCIILKKQGARAMKKILGGSKKKKFYTSDVPTLPSASNIFGKTSFETKVTGNPRRSTVLNKLFMRHITDLMVTGEYSNELLGYGIEVNKVQIAPDYRILKIYWIAQESEDLESVEHILSKNAGFLRNELSQLRVMGEVPKIIFVKDKSYSKIAEVEQKLAIADFGEDYQPTELAEKFKSGYEVWTTLDSTVKAKLEKLDTESVEKLDDLSEIPPMPQNVLGLDHDNILKKIKKRMSAAEAPHRKNPAEESDWAKWSQFKMTQPINSDPIAYSSQQEQRQAFKEFWQQRQLLKMKERRIDKNWTPDSEYIQEEIRERHTKALENDDFELEEDDCITDDFEDEEKI